MNCTFIRFFAIIIQWLVVSDDYIAYTRGTHAQYVNEFVLEYYYIREYIFHDPQTL